MSVYEIVFGVILIAVSLFIIVFTLAQETKGQACPPPSWATTALWPPAVSAAWTPSWPRPPRSAA